MLIRKIFDNIFLVEIFISSRITASGESTLSASMTLARLHPILCRGAYATNNSFPSTFKISMPVSPAIILVIIGANSVDVLMRFM